MRWCEIFEMAAPTDEMKSAVYYHGCPIEAKAQSIINNGISPQDISIKGQKARGHLTPISGRVYLAQDLAYSVIYALGGSFAGSPPMDGVLSQEGQFGYLFVVPGSQLADVQPDEDSIGEFFSKYSESPNRYHHSPTIQFKGDGKDDSDKRQVWHYIYGTLTPTQRQKILRGEYAYYASGGKRSLKTMPDWMKLKMIEWGSHVANEGAVIPSQVWKIDKRRSAELNKDGSNFFDIAVRVK